MVLLDKATTLPSILGEISNKSSGSTWSFFQSFFSKAKTTRISDWAGIIPLEKRFEDLQERYQKKYSGSEQDERRHKFEQALTAIESQLQAVSTIQLSEITDHLISGTIDTLQNWELAVSDNWMPDL